MGVHIENAYEQGEKINHTTHNDSAKNSLTMDLKDSLVPFYLFLVRYNLVAVMVTSILPPLTIYWLHILQ